LEARDRVGGRVWSRTLPNGVVVEMGAEFILPGCSEVLGLVERFGLGLWDKGMRYGDREPRGVDVRPGELGEAGAVVEAALSAGEPSGSARDFLAGLDLSEGQREAILARVEVSAASSADLVPAAELGVLARISRDPAPGVAGGNGRLPEALAGALGPRVHLRSAVRGIRWGEEGVTARTDEGEVNAETCVIAIPASVIGSIDFEPPLPDAYAEALGAIVYGHAAKLFVPLDALAPPSASLAVPDRYWAWTATGEGNRPQPVVSAFAGSPAALEDLGIERGAGGWLARLADLRPDLEMRPAEAVLSTWDDDPHVGAAYSLLSAPGIIETLGRPLGPIAFAGEHLGGEMGALMEGAIRSGQRAAEAIRARPAH
jgi:monoamine oxidase